jgi:hypothetical protein
LQRNARPAGFPSSPDPIAIRLIETTSKVLRVDAGVCANVPETDKQAAAEVRAAITLTVAFKLPNMIPCLHLERA